MYKDYEFLNRFFIRFCSFSIIPLRGTRDNKKKDRSMNFCRIFKKIFKSYHYKRLKDYDFAKKKKIIF